MLGIVMLWLNLSQFLVKVSRVSIINGLQRDKIVKSNRYYIPSLPFAQQLEKCQICLHVHNLQTAFEC